jgi:hypothetical protein
MKPRSNPNITPYPPKKMLKKHCISEINSIFTEDTNRGSCDGLCGPSGVFIHQFYTEVVNSLRSGMSNSARSSRAKL